MTPAEAQIEMRARIRAHMVASVIGAVVGFVGAGLLGAAAAAAPEGIPRLALTAAAVLAFFSPAPYGIYSAFKRVRCPACNRKAVWEMQWQLSPFRAPGGAACRGCGIELFAPSSRSFARTLVVAIAVAAALMMAIGVMSFVLAKRSQPVMALPGAAAP